MTHRADDGGVGGDEVVAFEHGFAVGEVVDHQAHRGMNATPPL